jgi:hypothetical protein
MLATSPCRNRSVNDVPDEFDEDEELEDEESAADLNEDED